MQTNRYHPLIVSLHWLIFLLFAVALIAIEYRGQLPKGDPAIGNVMAIHKQAGVLVFVFAIVRLLTRLSTTAPAILSRWPLIRFVAHAIHVVLYSLMFALPITGTLLSQSSGRAVMLFGWTLPTLVEKNPGLHDSIESVHVFLGNSVYFLVGLHVLAALWHHFVLRDQTLLHMSFRKQN
ncbi:MAG: cytochrome b [Betaproteobacteria bacterium]|nr:cytochrome b [Betaproteobacteria bacterium]